MFLFVYRLSILFYVCLVYLLSGFHHKARAWHLGRRHWLRNLCQNLAQNSKPVVWIHAASLGEFEQSRPVIEGLRARYGNRFFLLVSFFSPSGYTLRHDYPLADYVCCLPLDTPRNAREFVAIVQPTLTLWVKYEFWYYHLRAVQATNSPVILFAANFRPSHIFFRPWGGDFRRLLQGFAQIFVQNHTSAQLLQGIGISQVQVAPDTRFDRTAAIAEAAEEIEIAQIFKAGKPLLVAGSVWTEDCEAVIPAWLSQRDSWKLLIAPHEISPDMLRRIIQQCATAKVLRYSELGSLSTECLAAADVLLIDNVGLLARLYRYADMAFVGGAYRQGLHNILEPAAFGCPIFFGTKYHKYPEAAALIALGSAWAMSDSADFVPHLAAYLIDNQPYKDAGEAARQYVQAHRGGSDAVLGAVAACWSV